MSVNWKFVRRVTINFLILYMLIACYHLVNQDDLEHVFWNTFFNVSIAWLISLGSAWDDG